MDELLTADFVEHHVTPLHWSQIPESWELESHELFYQLDLKMCNVRTLAFAFLWGSESEFTPYFYSVLEEPSKIVLLDVSKNELTSLSHDGLLPFQNLRVLDASCNQLRHIHGIEVLHKLYSLNLSYNKIRNVVGLLSSHTLEELNLSNNVIEDISSIPSQINLRVLHLNNNKLQSLKGVTSFPKLEEIYADQNELIDLVHLSACFHLRILSVVNNHIRNIDCVLSVIWQLKQLSALNLTGNPVEREKTYQSDILRVGQTMSLNNVSVRPVSVAMKSLTSVSRHRGKVSKNDYRNVKETDELLRCTFNELVRQRGAHLD